MSWAKLLGPPAPCSGCGVELSWQRCTVQDRFIWADAEGRTQVATGLPHPLTVAYGIGERILAATTGPKRKRGPMPSDEECDFYSVVINCPWACGTPHLHRHDDRPTYGPLHGPEDVEWCCHEPMHLRPSGWHCRARCGATRPFLVAV